MPGHRRLLQFRKTDEIPKGLINGLRKIRLVSLSISVVKRIHFIQKGAVVEKIVQRKVESHSRGAVETRGSLVCVRTVHSSTSWVIDLNSLPWSDCCMCNISWMFTFQPGPLSISHQQLPRLAPIKKTAFELIASKLPFAVMSARVMWKTE
ncbi:hypothetical protein CEXT_661181 [Caerostris extrusa]|uniref:Uncharacterized protein n=1 Tax=Caerostris extrusa TaxID=172846 RepID=A0AAV4S8G6_CAEEX|nr:hypothetical protein CEXT_661181 [Caerostris extrusa]